MECYLISYDLLGQDRDYSDLIEEIKGYKTWAHITRSQWAVVSELSAVEIRDRLKEYLQKGDRIFVVKSGVEAAWSNVICSNEWLKKYL